MYYLFYITKYVHVIHTLASHLQDNRETGVSQGSMSQSRQGTPSVTATCLVLSSILSAQPQDLVSYSFLLLSTMPDFDRQGLVSYSFLLSSYYIRCKRMCPVSLAFFFLYHCRRQPQDHVSLVSSFFYFFLLLSSSFFWQQSFSHTSLHPILTKLGHNDWYLNHYSGTKDGGVRGHHGVTGVKKVICTKKASSPSDYVALTRDLCICSSLTPSTKVMVLKNCQGSFGVTGVKSSFSQKRHQVLQIM